jgi:general secretion pathway protein K
MNGDRQERGFALVTVLWAAMVLAAIAASITATGRTEARLNNTRYSTARLGAIAEGAINIAILRMLDPAPAGHPPADGIPFTLAFAGGSVSVRVEDEAGKIDLNLNQGELLRRLFVEVGVEPLAAQGLVDKILDWREAGAGRRLNGAKAEDYRDAGFAYRPRAAPFESVAELQLVMGITPALFVRVAPSLTVYSQSAWVDPAFAPPDVLAALAGMDAAPESEILVRRAAGEGAPVMIGHAFTIEAEIGDTGGLRVQRNAIVRLTGSPKLPLVVYRWN